MTKRNEVKVCLKQKDWKCQRSFLSEKEIVLGITQRKLYNVILDIKIYICS